MAALHSLFGQLPVYDEPLGSPMLKMGMHSAVLVPNAHRHASRFRLKQGFSVSLKQLFNFQSVLITPFLEGNDIVFPRFNGTVMFRLQVAGSVKE